MWRYRQNESFINLSPEVNVGHHVESVPFILLLHKQLNFTWKSAVRLDKKLGTVFLRIVWLRVTKWCDLRLLIVQKCNNKKTWVFVFFRICFYLSMCKITFFSCFVVISNVFTRFINDSVSLRIEPLTVRNCSPWMSRSALNCTTFRECNTLQLTS